MNKKLTEQEIDALVIAQADDDSAWEVEIIVGIPKIPQKTATTLN